MSDKKSVTPFKHSLFFGWYMVAASWTTFFILSAVAMSIFFKPILEEFNLDRATLSSVQTFAMLVFAVASPFLGRLIDRFGARAILFVCAVIQTLSIVLTGLASNLWHIYFGRLLFEIRSTQAANVLINHWFIKKRGKALGIVSTGMPLGTLILSPLSQYMVLTLGWRETLFLWGGVLFLVLFSFAVIARNKPEDKGLRPDGDSLQPACIFSREIPDIDNTKNDPRSGFDSTFSEALKSAPFWLLSSSQLICGVGCGFMMTHVVIFATDLGYSDMVGATFLSIQGLISMLGVLITGYMSDRIVRNRVLAFAHLIRSGSFILIACHIFMNGSSLWALYTAMALFGFGWISTAPLSSGLIADLFGNLRMGTILGLMMSFHVIGTAIGSVAGGITFELTGSYLIFFFIQGILEFLAAFFAYIIKRG